MITAIGVVGSQLCGKSPAPSRSANFSSGLSLLMFGVKKWQPTLLSRELCHWGGDKHTTLRAAQLEAQSICALSNSFLFHIGNFKKSDSSQAKISSPPSRTGQSSVQWEISAFHPGTACPTAACVTQHKLQANSSVYSEAKRVIVHYVASVISDPNESMSLTSRMTTDSERAPIPKPCLFPQQLSFSDSACSARECKITF